MATDPVIVEADDAAIERAGGILRGGGLVAFPTETVYGLGANALDPAAVTRIFDVKGRPTFDPLIVHVAQVADARGLAADWPVAATKLAEALWPGPLTLVVARRTRPALADPQASGSRSGVVADLVTSGLPTVGLRVPAHPVARALIRAAGVPIAAPSANRFGAISPTRAQHVLAEFAGRGDAIGLILDGGPCETGIESTVIGVTGDGPPVVLRVGGVSLEAIRTVVGEVELARPGAAVASPGMLERHYAPRTPLAMMDDGWRSAEGGTPTTDGREGRVGLLCFQHPPPSTPHPPSHVEILSPTGDLREAAATLFAAMRRLDEAGLDVIFAESAPDRGLGRAINDRLRRASLGRG